MKGQHAGAPPAVDFSRAPFLVIWETTRSCGLACRHCRAEAVLGRDSWELSTQEGKRLLDQTAAMGTPIFIFSGGDPLNRPDLEELVAHGKKTGLRLGTIPAATRNLTLKRLMRLKEAGLDQVAFSIDAPSGDAHDSFRGVEGAFAKTLQGIGFAHQAKIPVQVNTVLADWNFGYLERMIEMVKSLGVSFWEVFFLIPMGRGKVMQSIAPAQFEEAFERFHRLNREAPFVIKLTEAPHYRRFVIQKETAASASGAGERIRHVLARPRGVGGSLGLSPQAVNAGKGFAFVDHLGNVCPSGFLPVPAGNVRAQPLAEIYRHAPLFRELRDPRRLKGKCGVCEFSAVCGGSRARAAAATGDHLESDPFCSYLPQTAGAA